MLECRKCPLYIANGGYYGSICYGEDDIVSCVPKYPSAAEKTATGKTVKEMEPGVLGTGGGENAF